MVSEAVDFSDAILTERASHPQHTGENRPRVPRLLRVYYPVDVRLCRRVIREVWRENGGIPESSCTPRGGRHDRICHHVS